MHSPTPWRLVRDNELDFLVDANGQTIAIVDGLCRENAEALLNAVNLLTPMVTLGLGIATPKFQ